MPDTAAPKTKSRGAGSLKWFKIAISAALLWYVIGMVDWDEARGYIRSADWRYLSLFACVLPITVALSVLKWWRLLAARQRPVSYGRLYGLYVLGQFYHNALPSSVGGDVVRGVMVNKEVGSAKETVSSIAAERLTGMTILAIMGIVAVLMSPEIRENWAVLCAAGVSVAAYMTMMAMLFLVRLDGAGPQRFENVSWLKEIRRRTVEFQKSMRDYRHCGGVLVEALVYSALFYLGTMMSAFLGCRAVGEPVPLAIIFVAVPIVHLVGVLPISLNGIGLKEWAMTASFVALGANPTVGLIVALLLRVRLIIWSVLGYAIWTMRNTGRVEATTVQAPSFVADSVAADEVIETAPETSTVTQPERV